MDTKRIQCHLIKSICNFVNGYDAHIPIGLVNDTNGIALIHIDNTSHIDIDEIYTLSRRILTTFARDGGTIAIANEVSIHSSGYTIIMDGEAGAGHIIPSVRSYAQLPYAVAAIAICTDTGNGDCLADRISRCNICDNFFMRITRKRTKFCSTKCRNRDKNNRRMIKAMATVLDK